MRRALGDTAISIVALAILFVSLALVDPRLRERLARLTGAQGGADVRQLGWEVREVSAMALDAASYQVTMHAPLVIFTLAAVVLVLFMVRT